MRRALGAGVLIILAACGRAGDQGDAPATVADTGAMAGMPDVGGMGGMMSGGMIESMQTHMRMMDTANGDQMQAMLPPHRQMAGNMLAQMNREMRGMSMTGDAGWTALMDSVRQDLVRMPEMNAQQLEAFMPAHHGRLTRLMQGHRDMMQGMKM